MGNTDQSSSDEKDSGLTGRLIGLAFQALPAIGAAVGFLGFVAAVGGSLTWVRFSAVGLPGNQAILDTSRSKLIVEGAWALAIFVVLGLAAVLVGFVGRSRARGTAGFGFAALASVEMLVVFYWLGRWKAVGGLVAWLLIVGAASYALGWARLSGAARWFFPVFDRWRLRAAHRRWEQSQERTIRAQTWLAQTEALPDAARPADVISAANTRLARAIESQGRSEDRLAELVSVLAHRYKIS